MATIADKQSNHISNVVNGIVALLANTVTLQGLIVEAQQQGYLTGGANALTDTSFVGANAYMTAAVYNAAMAELIALQASLLTAGPNNSPSIYAALLAMKP